LSDCFGNDFRTLLNKISKSDLLVLFQSLPLSCDC
jgi:hypothetical protein